MAKKLNLRGQVFGRLLVLAPLEHRTKRGDVRWLCACNCGEFLTVVAGTLSAGRATACGCANGRRKHGHFVLRQRTPEYHTWCAMKARCNNPNSPNYADYGGRGITVAPAWQCDFRQFLKDMGERPIGTTIDRIEVDGNYEPGNCRWATAEIQSRNQRRVIRQAPSALPGSMGV